MTKTDNFIRYLLAKRTVDDRALNRHVWQTLAAQVANRSQPLQLLEVGAGVGTMVERLVAWELLTAGHYTAVDANSNCIAHARQRLGDRYHHLDLTWQTADLLHFARKAPAQQWDLILAHALLDLVDVPQVLPQLFKLLRPGGLFYFSLNFDGATIFEPALPGDTAVLTAYHQAMDDRPGGSQTGRQLFHQVQAAGGQVLAMGSSDWVVYPQNGIYAADETFFLHYILDTIDEALANHTRPDAALRQSWLQQRRAQIEGRQLVYIAHQLDLVGAKLW
jgi:ubiquinone/menaquinone biosynthesis C-methylase UbiE